MEATLSVLRDAAKTHDSVLVGFSGGKDSLVVTDLCCRVFKHVQGFYMYLVPGLRVIEEHCEAARQRWGLHVDHFPHWLLARFIKDGLYCDNHYKHDGLPQWTLADVYAAARKATGIQLIATGAKDADSAHRRRLLRWNKDPHLIHPVQSWHKHDVIAYLKAHNIPMPPGSGRQTSGIDLSTPEVLWLHDHYPDDFEKLTAYFPYAEAIVWRRKWFGVTEETHEDAA